MRLAERREMQLIEKFGLRGSFFEQLIMEPEGWVHTERLQDSPNVQRYAMDVRQALEHEGWRAPAVGHASRRRG
jgi:hypothetical protein